MPGFILIDKPAGPTSHDIVAILRRITGEKTIGHAGTLDPFATGLLIVGVEREATKEMQKLVGLDKEYEAEFVFGAVSDTDDVTGTITQRPLAEPLTTKSVQEAVEKFVGDIKQVPPAYSAIKIAGKKMYESAREGKPVEAKPRNVTIYSIKLLGSENELTYRVLIHCSSGTYIRALARDIGTELGTGGYVKNLRRTKIGPFSIKEAITPDVLNNSNWQEYLVPVQTVLTKTSTFAILKTS